MKTCRNGHQYDSIRKECPECHLERAKRWAEENPDKRKRMRKEREERKKL